jgi:hypothetical protein
MSGQQLFLHSLSLPGIGGELLDLPVSEKYRVELSQGSLDTATTAQVMNERNESVRLRETYAIKSFLGVAVAGTCLCLTGPSGLSFVGLAAGAVLATDAFNKHAKASKDLKKLDESVWVKIKGDE